MSDYFFNKIVVLWPNPQPPPFKSTTEDYDGDPGLWDPSIPGAVPENVFCSLLDFGHGVRAHKTDNPLEGLGKLNLDPAKCPHHMALEDELKEDFKTSPWEQLVPLEAGPWEDEFFSMEEDDMVVIGYQIATNDEEFYDETYDILERSHIQEQQEIDSFEYACEQAIRTSELAEAKAKRKVRFEKILLWLSTTEFKKVQSLKGKFWHKVNTSRKLCGKYGKWGWVYLTKQQVDACNEVIKFRTKEYLDSFKR